MALKHIIGNVYAISFGFVNAFLIDQNGLTLIDCGLPGSFEKIKTAIQTDGRQVTDIKNILITHLHRDHTGGLAETKKATGASVFMHAADAGLIRHGIFARPSQPAPGLISAIFSGFIRLQANAAPGESVVIEHEIQNGDILEKAGGLQVIHTPGHTVGHVVFYLPQMGGILWVGDALSNLFGIGHPPIYEDFNLAKISLKKIASLKYDTICFSHGNAIVGNASQIVQRKIDKMIAE